MSRSIEFIRDGKLEKLYFQILDVEMMSQSYRTRVLSTLNWNTAQDKVRGLLHAFKSMESAIEVQKTLKKWSIFRSVEHNNERSTRNALEDTDGVHCTTTRHQLL